MGEISELEEALLIAAADADSRQYDDLIVEPEQEPKFNELDFVKDSINSFGTKRKSDHNVHGQSSKRVLVADISEEYKNVSDNAKRKRVDDVSEESAKSIDGYAKVVATHYNQIEEKGLDERSKSHIVYLRNFHNWIKSMLINEYLTKIKEGKKFNAPIRVHDMCCGKGGDLLKWRKGGISHLICSDIASESLEHCKGRYDAMKNRGGSRDRGGGSIYSIEYISCDCSRMRYREKYSDPSMKLDLVSCQFACHYSFGSLQQAECMLMNAAECLQPGGYFIGTIPDAYDLIARAKRNGSNTYGNNVYRVTLDFDLHKPELFGSKYNFQLDGVVNCPEFLIYFPLFIKLAKKFGLKLVKREKFYDFYERMKSKGRQLLSNMRGMEAYPPHDNATLVGMESDYDHAREFIQTKREDVCQLATLSKSEWDASCLYTTFVFEKVKNTWNTDGTPVYDI